MNGDEGIKLIPQNVVHQRVSIHLVDVSFMKSFYVDISSYEHSFFTSDGK